MSQPDSRSQSIDPESSLTSAQFHILLTLAQGDRHGYGIMQEIERRTDGVLELGPGTLYRSIKQLLSRGLIVEVEGDAPGQGDAGRPRRTYGISPRGKIRAREESIRLRSLVHWAETVIPLEG